MSRESAALQSREGKTMTRLTLRRIREIIDTETDSSRAELGGMFWDWWSRKESLPAKAQKFCRSMLRVADALGFPDTVEVDLKENCPGVGRLYVSCQFHDGDTMLGWFTPSSGHDADRSGGTVAQYHSFTPAWPFIVAPNVKALIVLIKERRA
jgi:hypothetical protein